MAIAFDVVYTVLDASGDTGEFSIPVPTGFALSDYVEFGQAMAQLVDGVVLGLIAGVGLGISVDVSGLTNNSAVQAGDVEDVGAFRYVTGDDRRVSINIPGISETLVSANSDDLDTTDPDIAAFNAAILSGIAVTGGTISPCDIAEDDIVSLASARERFRSTA